MISLAGKQLFATFAALSCIALAMVGCNAQTAAAKAADDVLIGTGATGGNGGVVGNDAGSTDSDNTGPKVFSPNIGVSCAGDVDCPADDVQCVGDSNSASAICSVTCGSDTDCPADFQCRGLAGNAFCQPRSFCSQCTDDAQCGAGGRCIAMGDGKFCSRDCTKKTGCPRYAMCNAVDEGGMACVHTAGSCQGDGSLCSSCAATGGCGEGGQCLTFSYSGEQFCSAPCDGSTCAAGFSCEQISADASVAKQCVPSDPKQPKCVSSLHGTMEANDIFTDFSIVGYTDTDGNGNILTLADGGAEPAKRIKFSEYAASGDFKVILFNVAAGWCGPCQQETTGFKQLLKTYPNLGIYQVIFDGKTQNTPAKLDLARTWIKNLGGVGATGVDFDKSVSPLNTAGSTPLNMIIDAKTFKILKKFNGAPAGGMASTIAPYMK